jgi:hypothetical protein
MNCPYWLDTLKMWAFKTVKVTISNISLDRFTHIFKRVDALL